MGLRVMDGKMTFPSPNQVPRNFGPVFKNIVSYQVIFFTIHFSMNIVERFPSQCPT